VGIIELLCVCMELQGDVLQICETDRHVDNRCHFSVCGLNYISQEFCIPYNILCFSAL
jgi:hypothetical protein